MLIHTRGITGMLSRHAIEVATVMLGAALGAMTVLIWQRVGALLGQDGFWHRFAAVARSLFSPGAEDRFLRDYFRLSRALAGYVGKKLLTLVVAFLPVIIVVTFIPGLKSTFFIALILGSVVGWLLFRVKRN